MDEAAVRALLKDQSDVIHAQPHTQSALHVELQAIRGLGSTDVEQAAIHDYRDPCVWRPPRDAVECFRWMSRNNLITNWEGFLESVHNRFGPCKFEDPHRALSKLSQLGTVAQYQSDFEKLVNRVTEIPKKLLISFYISGLELSLQQELLVSKPTTLSDAFSLSRVTEPHLEDQGMSSVSSKATGNNGGDRTTTPRFTFSRQEPVKSALLPTPPKPNSNASTTPIAIKWSSPEHDEALESGDISILYSLVGHGSPRTLQIWVMIDTDNVHVLIDNGSIYNFIQLGVVERMQLPITITKPFKVYIDSGETLLCENIYSKVLIKMKGLSIKALLETDEVYEVYELYSVAVPDDETESIQALNAVMVKDCFPIPTVDEMFDELGRA
nr:hypothetical protein [Tanacetum cinerariifolium]